MGRIADALKRAQKERERCAQSAAAGTATTAPVPEPPAHERLPDEDLPSAEELIHAKVLRRPRPKPFTISAEPIPASSVDPTVVIHHEPTSPIAEKYRSVRTRLLTTNPAGGARSFAITSSLPREGKTVTTANLGFSLAELRHVRVAMIDLDLRERGLSRRFHVQDRPGMAEVLRGETSLADACVPIIKQNLILIPAGNPGSATPSELLAGEAAKSAFRQLSEQFHYGLVDTPPVSTAADIGLIAPLCHSVLMVVRMARTPEPILTQCVEALRGNHITISGCILAGCEVDVKASRGGGKQNILG